MNKTDIRQSGFATAMRAMTAQDVYLSLGLAGVVIALTSVIGSI